MDYKQDAIDDLRYHDQRKEALLNLADRIAALEAAIETSPVPGPDTISVTGTKPTPDAKWIDNIMERQRLQHDYDIAKSRVDAVEAGLNTLTARQREILEKSYMPNRQVPWYIHAEELSISKSRYYQEREAALHTFTIAMYGTSNC